MYRFLYYMKYIDYPDIGCPKLQRSENNGQPTPKALNNPDISGNNLKERERGPGAVKIIPQTFGPLSQTSYDLDSFIKVQYNPVQAENRTGCVSGYIIGQSAQNTFFRPVCCGKEYCPICGADESIIHNRRMDRVHNRVMAMRYSNNARSIGYLVLTIPDDLRDVMDREALLAWKTYWKRKLKRAEYITTKIRARNVKTNRVKVTTIRRKRSEYKNGLIRYHWCGDDATTYKPHLNILIPGAYLSRSILDSWKNDNAKFLQNYFKLEETPNGNLYYGYSNKLNKIRHFVRYVTRSTFRNVTRDNQYLLTMLNGFRNLTCFGEFDYTHIPKDLFRGDPENRDEKDNSQINYFGFTREYLPHIKHGRASGVEYVERTGVIRANNKVVALDDNLYRNLKQDKNEPLPQRDVNPPGLVVLEVPAYQFQFMEIDKRMNIYWRIIEGTARIV